ncbi:unnamed protein product [Parajaminaea phylloscopi]
MDIKERSPPASSASTALFKKKKRSRPEPSTRAAPRNSGHAGEEGAAERGDDAFAEPSSSAVVTKARKVDTSNPLVSSSGISLARRKRLAAAQEAEDDDDDADADAKGARYQDEYSSVAVRAKADANGSQYGRKGDSDATRAVDWYDEEDGHAKKPASGGVVGGESNDDGVYRGMSSYSSALPQPASRNKHTQRGPIKAPTNIRTVTVVDYQPDVCKDYKETGYCGFGDTCKFLHDRSDYLAGWQMEAAYLPNSTARDLGQDIDGSGREGGADDDDDEEDEVPFACLICRQPFTDPVITRCGHYFCSSCAVRRFTKTPKCFACGAQTGGIFNSATKIIDRMAKRRQAKDDERQERRRAWGRVDGEEGDEGEERADGQLLEGVEIGGASDDE